MKSTLLMTTLVLALASCGESEKETHGNLQADPNFDGSQDKLLPGSRHPGPSPEERAKKESEEDPP